MMSKYITIIIAVGLLVLGSCKRPHNKPFNSSVSCDLSINDLKKLLLFKELKDCELLRSCFDIKDTLIYSEDDETTRWKGRSFFKDQKLIFIAETNWENSQIISRITIYDAFLNTNENFHVGSKFMDIRDNISQKIPSVPDGYLFVKDSKDNSISYELEISSFPDSSQIRYGVGSLDEIPDTLRVSRIVIN